MSRTRVDRVWAELDAEAIRHNAREICRQTGVPLRAVVKANGYGHGALAVAVASLAGGAEALATASPAEALELRQAGVGAPIQVLGAHLMDELPAALAARAELTVTCAAELELLERAARRAGRPLAVHLQVDTGMARHGVSPDQALPALRDLHGAPGLDLVGLMTHYSQAASPDVAFTREQTRRFTAVVAAAEREGLRPPRVHAASSLALARDRQAAFDQVRPGIALLGLDPGGFLAEQGFRLSPALSVQARVLTLRQVTAGQPVGYGGSWRPARPSTLAVLGVGYGDGLPYQLTGQGAEVLLQGQRCPVVGTVMMDYLFVDVSGLPAPVQPGDIATLIGQDGAQRLRLEDHARRAGLIPYALACSLGARLDVRSAAGPDVISGGDLRLAA